MPNRIATHPEDVAVLHAKFNRSRSQTSPFDALLGYVLRPALLATLGITIGAQRHCRNVGLINGKRSPHVRDGGGKTVRGKLIFELLRAQKQVTGIQVSHRLVSQPLDLGELKLRADRGNHAFGKPILQVKYIAQIPIEAIGPDMRPSCGVNEFAGETHAIATAANAALNHIADAEFAPDLAHVDRPSSVGE